MKFLEVIILWIILIHISHQTYGQLPDSAVTKVQIINPTFLFDYNKEMPLSFKSMSMTYSRGYLWKSGPYVDTGINEKIRLAKTGVSYSRSGNDSIVSYTSKHVEYSRASSQIITLHADETFPFKLSLWNPEEPVWYNGTVTTIFETGEQQASYEFYQSFLVFQMHQGSPLINGKSVKLNTVKYHGEYKGKAKMIADIIALQEANANTVIVQKLDSTWLQLCDSLGMYVIMEHSLSKSNEKSFKEYLEFFNDNSISNEYVANIKFGSLLFFYVDSDSKTQLRSLNQSIPFFARYPNTFYGKHEIFKLDIPIAKTYYADSAMDSKINSKTLQFLKEKYQFIDYGLTHIREGSLTVTNNFDFINAAGLKFKWKLLHKNLIQEGSGILPNLPPGETVRIKLNILHEQLSNNGLYAMEVSFLPKKEGDFNGRVFVTQPKYQEYDVTRD